MSSCLRGVNTTLTKLAESPGREHARFYEPLYCVRSQPSSYPGPCVSNPSTDSCYFILLFLIPIILDTETVLTKFKFSVVYIHCKTFLSSVLEKSYYFAGSEHCAILTKKDFSQ